jgi:hypothetical protein
MTNVYTFYQINKEKDDLFRRIERCKGDAAVESARIHRITSLLNPYPDTETVIEFQFHSPPMKLFFSQGKTPELGIRLPSHVCCPYVLNRMPPLSLNVAVCSKAGE